MDIDLVERANLCNSKSLLIAFVTGQGLRHQEFPLLCQKSFKMSIDDIKSFFREEAVELMKLGQILESRFSFVMQDLSMAEQIYQGEYTPRYKRNGLFKKSQVHIVPDDDSDLEVEEMRKMGYRIPRANRPKHK